MSVYQQDHGEPVKAQSCFYNKNEEELASAPTKSGMEDLIALDAGSSFGSMCNRGLCSSVCDADESMQMNANAGSRVLGEKGEVINLDHDPWFDDKSRANVFSFDQLQKQH